MRIKHIYNNMHSNLVRTLLFLLIVIIMSISVLKSVTSVKYYKKEYTRVKEALDSKMYSVNAVNAAKIVKSELDEDDAKKVLQTVDSEYNMYYFSNQPIYLSDFNGSENIGLDINKFPNGNFLNNSIYSVNTNFFKLNDIDIEDGRNFTEEELKVSKYDKKINKIPILMGYKYKKYFHLGQDVLISNPEEQIVGHVIGFMKENTTARDYNKILSDNNVNIDSIVLTSYAARYTYSDNLKNVLFGNGILQMNKGMTVTELNESLNILSQDLLDRLNIKIGFSDINKTINEEYQYMLSIIIIRIISTVIICLLSISTLSILSLMSIEKRKKEFGIHILSGSTKLDLYKCIIIEQLILTIIPYIWVLTYLTVKVGLAIDNYIAIIGLLIISVVIGVITYISIRRIYITPISMLVKGQD